MHESRLEFPFLFNMFIFFFDSLLRLAVAAHACPPFLTTFVSCNDLQDGKKMCSPKHVTPI